MNAQTSQPFPISSGMPMPLVTDNGSTYQTEFDSAFLAIAAEDIAAALNAYGPQRVVLNAYTAPWEKGRNPQGQLNIALVGEKDELCCLGITFGVWERRRSAVRYAFDTGAFQRDPHNPHTGGIVVANFDECWSLVCHVLARISPLSVHFSFGT